jgi:hypothetical protein
VQDRAADAEWSGYEGGVVGAMERVEGVRSGTDVGKRVRKPRSGEDAVI